MSKQPKALYVLNFVSMWECFSYYGMRALLVLYMVQALGFSDSKALACYALYTTLIELGGIFGGIAADRYLGLRRAIWIGGVTIALGHIVLAMNGFFAGLALIVAGTSLFRSNVPALLGHFYAENDPRRDAGYTLYYTGMNIGGFLATILCAVVAEVWGWHAGFGLAALGMFLGLLLLFFGRHHIDVPIQTTDSFRGITSAVKKLWFFVLLLVLFYACEEQLGSSLVIFSERHVDRATLFGTLPSGSLITFNPLTILLVGPFVARLSLSPRTKFALSFLFLAAAFSTLYGACFMQSVPLSVAVISVVLISLGELFLAPTVYAAVSRAADRSQTGACMGVVAVGFSLANLASGACSQMMAEGVGFMNGFLAIGIGAFAFATLLFMRRNISMSF